MTGKKKFLLRLSAFLMAINICLGMIPFTAEASETKIEYGVTGKIVADSAIFNGETTVEVTNGYYLVQPNSWWRYFYCESKDGTLKFNYYLEKDNIYRFIVTDQEETTYHANDGGILENDGSVLGTVFNAEGYEIDFSNLTFTEVKERFPEGFYVGTGTNSLNADYIAVELYDTVIDIDFYKSGKRLSDLGGNYTLINTEGTMIFTHDYKGSFRANVTKEGRLYGSFISEDKVKQIEFDLQLNKVNTIKPGSYLSKGSFSEDIDEIRIHFTGTDFILEMVNANSIIKSYELAVKEVKQDGTVVLESFYDGNTISNFEISSDGKVTGKLTGTLPGEIPAAYDIDLNMTLVEVK